MNKLTCLFALFLLAAAAAQADLVDNFDSYEAGLVGEVASPPWVTTEAEMYAEIGDDNGNRYLSTWSNSGSGYRDVSRQLEPAVSPISSLSTLFLRVYVVNDSVVDYGIGLCGDAAGTTGGDGTGTEWYADFGPYFRLISNGTTGDGLIELSVRNGGSFVDDLAYLNTGQWYNFWLVINPTSGSGVHDLYYAADGEPATLARAANGFRDAYSTPLQSFLVMTNGNDAAARNIRIDDLYVLPGEYLNNPLRGLPNTPSVEFGATAGSTVSTTLRWMAGEDPDGVYAVNPAIVDQYVFRGTDLDPNLIYVGATAADPGTDVADSEFTLNSQLDRTYYWKVVEAIDGYAQSLTAGVSDITDVDPNNIVGPTWFYEAPKSLPTITAQPVDARVFATDASAVFTVTFSSPVNAVTATWYKNDVALTGSEPDVTIDTDPYASSSLTIATPEPGDEGKYYCVLSVQDGMDDDLQTATRLLIIKKTLAAFDFEQTLADGSGNNAPSGVVRSVDGLAEPNSLAAPAVTPTWVAGIEGSAVYLNGTEFIDLGTEAYPKAGPLETYGDARGEDYEKTGFGRGMEQGSILCWVKPESTGAVFMNANAADSTHFGLSLPGENSGRFIMRGWNWDESYQEIGTAQGSLQMTDYSLQDGQWHMLAATWQDSTVRVYLNGEQVASASAGTPEMYLPWELSSVVGASRPSSNRAILTDFLTGAIDSLRVYNYVIAADEIAREYRDKNESGYIPCMDHAFEGNAFNFDNSGFSYCKVDLADFAVLAANWLSSGLFTEQ